MNVVMSRSKEPTFVTFLSILPRRDKDRLDYAFERDDLFWYRGIFEPIR